MKTKTRVTTQREESSEIPRDAGSQFIVKRIGPPLGDPLEVDTSGVILRIWRDFVASRDCYDGEKESVIVIALNHQYQFLGWHLVTTGTANAAHCGPRDILRAALAIDASLIVVVHNHPSGILSPSRHDEVFTKAIGEACKLLFVKFLDHVIVDSEGIDGYSMRGPYPEFFSGENATPSTARKVVTHSEASGAAAVLVKVSMPSVFTKGKGIHPQGMQDVLSLTLQHSTEQEWIHQWNTGSDLKGNHRRSAKMKRRYSREFLLEAEHFERVRRAAKTVGLEPEELLTAIIGRVCASLATWQKVRDAEVTSKIVPFAKSASARLVLS